MGSDDREQGRKGRAGVREALPPAAWRWARLCPEGEQPRGAPRALLPLFGGCTKPRAALARQDNPAGY